jgi:hypothetical protein
VGSCENDNEPWGCKKVGKFLDKLSDYQLLKKGSDHRSELFSYCPSVCVGTSTAISVEEGVTQEQIFENLRMHKEVLGSVKQQPWAMRRKLRLVQQAKAYVKRHEGELQERLAQSKTTRDILASFNIILIKVTILGGGVMP